MPNILIYPAAMPFVYHLYWSSSNTHYGGVRYSSNCHPNDLFTSYFTSSKHVKAFIETNGKPDIIEIVKVFDNKVDALSFEKEWLTINNAAKDPNWLNKNIGGKSFACEKHTSETKEKISKKIKGVPKSKSEIENRAKSLRGKKRSGQALENIRNGAQTRKNKPMPEKTKEKISNTLKGRVSPAKGKKWNFEQLKNHHDVSGENNPMFGKSHSQETKEKIKQKANTPQAKEERSKRMTEYWRSKKETLRF